MSAREFNIPTEVWSPVWVRPTEQSTSVDYSDDEMDVDDDKAESQLASVVWIRISPRGFKDIKSGVRRVEILAPERGSKTSEVRKGDSMVFIDSESSESYTTLVSQITWYPSTMDLMRADKVTQTPKSRAPSTQTVQVIEAVKYRDETIAFHGVFLIILDEINMCD